MGRDKYIHNYRYGSDYSAHYEDIDDPKKEKKPLTELEIEQRSNATRHLKEAKGEPTQELIKIQKQNAKKHLIKKGKKIINEKFYD